MSTTTEQSKTSEDLRLQGNDAFSTKDWDRAMSLYQQSIEVSDPSHITLAKTYSNLAATMCKLGKYQEANEAARRATIVDGKWAKAWWRRGVVAELMKDPIYAVNFYKIAVDLEPQTKAYKQALQRSRKMMGIRKNEKGPGGLPVLDYPKKNVEVEIPTKRAFMKVKEELDNLPVAVMMRKYKDIQRDFPTSEQYLMTGFAQWIGGIQCAVASLSQILSPEAKAAFNRFQLQFLQHSMNVSSSFEKSVEFCRGCERLLGGVPDEHSFEYLISGFAHLGGDNIFLETGQPDSCCPPSPRFIPNGVPVQMIACFFSIHDSLEKTCHLIGTKIICCKAVSAASKDFAANVGITVSNAVEDCWGQEPTPKECVAFMKKLIRNGYSWDTGVRRYCGLMYRGAMLYAGLIRLSAGPAGLAEAYKCQKWATEFIGLADEEFQVTKNRTYDEMGASFRHSIQIGLKMAFFRSHDALRGNDVNGPYSMEMSIDLLLDIKDMANQMTCEVPMSPDHPEFSDAMSDVAMKRKPLAFAHSGIASFLHIIEALFSLEEFKEIAVHHGLIENMIVDCDPFALIAEHYRIAAENELQDDPDAPIFWYGYAANMARSDPKSGFTIGIVRTAMKKARAAEEARDVSIFGVDQRQGTNTFEILTKMVGRYFRAEDDSFVLPQLEIDRGENGDKGILKIGDKVLCNSFEEYEKNVIENRGGDFTQLDNRETSLKHGQIFEGIPSLETLCIRALHKEGYEYAKGENDGVVIQHKAMLAMTVEEAKCK